ncbi:MFS transporter [Lacibacterium aquatile]|uniref:MFS transporter n=1 Tax=Lacibacterium aquatile TaxID=1168082 RepID=A0ABW5DW90_9PROT
MRYLSLLRRHRNFRLLALSQIPADFSDWLDFVAIGVLLGFVWQADAATFAWLGVAMALPYVVLGPIAGALVDRWPVRPVLIGSNGLRALATFLLFLAPSIPVLLGLILLRNCFDVFYGPAKQVAITGFVPEEDRLPANGLSYAIKQASKVLGPSLGSALLLILEPRSLFLLNGCLGLASAVILLRLTATPASLATGETTPSLWAHIIDGLRFIGSKPILIVSLLMMSGGFAAIFLYDLFIAILANELGFSKEIYGLSMVAVGIGGVIGALGIGLVNLERHSLLAIIIGAFLTGGLLILLGGGPDYGMPMPAALFLAIFAGLGLSTSFVMVPFRTLLQREAGADHIGRVSAVGETLDTLAILGAPFLGALIAKAYGTGASFVAGGMLMLILGLFALLGTFRRRT